MPTPLLALALACTPEPAPPPPPARPPNVLVFTLDTTRADSIGVYGNRAGTTPNIDAFARSAIRFTRASTVTPLTIPAHSSIFTGLLPPRHGVRDNGDFFLSADANTLAERLKAAGYATMASVGAEVTSHHWGFSQGFDQYFDDMSAADDKDKGRWRVERRGDLVVNDAVGWLEQHGGQDQPFFAWIHLFDAHFPYVAPEPYAGRYPKFPYLAEVAYLDSQIGRVLDLLQQKGWMDNTAIIMVADHGESLGQHGEAFHGVLLYSATTHIPMLVRPPGGVPGGASIGFPVSLVDVTPTALGLAGLPQPDGLDGMNLGPWLRGRGLAAADETDRAVYMEALYGYRHYGWAPQRALVTHDARFIDSTTPELYARDDLAEQTDLAARAATQVAVLKERMDKMYAAMKTDEALKQDAALSAEQQAQLEALGYMSAPSTVSGDGFDLGLPDPRGHLSSLRDLEKARAALQAGDLAGAETTVRDLVKREPGLTEAQSLLANVLARQGKMDEALSLLGALDAAQPSTSLKTTMGAMELRRGRYPEAVALLGAAVKLDPYLETAWAPYLQALFLQGDQQALTAAVAEVRKNLPDFAQGMAMEGVLLTQRGDLAGAEPLLKRASELDPVIPYVHFGLAGIAVLRGDAIRAEELYLDEIRISPPSFASRRELIKLYAGQQRWEDQLAQLEIVLKAQPHAPEMIQARAQALYNLKRYDEAGAAVGECLGVDPRSAGCKMLEANVLKRQGRPEEAERAYQAALRLRELEKRSQERAAQQRR